MSTGGLQLNVAGTQLWLRPDGTVWWPEQSTLFAADLHLGKGAAFRAQGQPVPAGRSAETLAHLEGAAQACGAAKLVLLGDLWHHASGLSDTLHLQLAGLMTRWPTTLVLGNHDLPLAKRALIDLPVNACNAPLALGPLLALHEADFAERHDAAAGFGLAGHLHPAVHLGGRGGDRLRRPCFLHFAGGLVLPAFGRWTGAWAKWPRDYAAEGARVAVVGETQVQWLPSQ
jgi:DNA ligase-associated metallophosphoesterase